MSIRRIVCFALLSGALAGAPPPACGAEFVPPENPPRFLFIIEKSDATRAQGLDISQTTFDLVYRGANGHLPDGGVFEIWIFGEETIYRGFPPQMLTPNNRLALASRASAYVRQARSGGPADVAKLIEHVRGASELGMELTIILVTSLDTRLDGTPRDAEINGVLDANAEAQRAAGRPFITSIRVQDGVLAASTVSESPFTMVVPAMPPSQLSSEERERRLTAARQARLEKEKPAVPPVTEVAVAPAPAPAPRRNRDIPDEEREGAIILRGTPRSSQPAPEPATTATSPAARAVAVESAVAPPSVPPATVAANSAAPAASPLTASPGAEASGRLTPQQSERVVAQPVGAPSPTNVSATEPAARAAAPNSEPVLPGTNAAAGPTNPAPQAAVTVPAQTWLTAGGLFVAGLCFFVVAALLAWVLLRRARAASGPSYITRSIEQHRE